MNPDEVDVWIIDSSALVKAKTIVAVNRPWASFKHLEQMVIEGRIALPRQVINERRRHRADRDGRMRWRLPVWAVFVRLA